MAITPDTRIGDFLEAHPDQQEALIGRIPAFAKLRNPVLRRTVARFATVAQAAAMAGLPAPDLVRLLRELAGEGDAPLPPAEAAPAQESRPDWARTTHLRSSLDADAVLAAGEHPLTRVRRALLTLHAGEILQLLSPFRPEPLLAQLRQEGLACWCEAEASGRFRTWILKG